jgi:hypothetical protein
MAGLTRASIHLPKNHFTKKMDHRPSPVMTLRIVTYPALDNWLGAGIATIGGLALRPST